MVNRLDGLKQAMAERKQIVTAERVINGNKMVETCKNKQGEVVKVSVFMDRNGDGNFTANEAVSVKYNALGSMCSASTEYRDTDLDGYCDEIAETAHGVETVSKSQPDKIKGNEGNRMDLKYGFKWDNNGPGVVYGKD